jgi:hypothetical protein
VDRPEGAPDNASSGENNTSSGALDPVAPSDLEDVGDAAGDSGVGSGAGVSAAALPAVAGAGVVALRRGH